MLPRRLLITLSTISFSFFCILTYLVESRSYFLKDYQLIDFTKSFTSPFTQKVLAVISWPGYFPQALFFISIAILLLVFTRHRLAAFVSLISFPSISFLVYLFKITVGRLRPQADLYLYSGADRSYPSGHVVSYTVILGLLFYISAAHYSSPYIKLFHLLSFFTLIFLTGISRIYLGHHWPTDVVGGFLLGFSWLCLTLIFLKPARKSSHTHLPFASN